MEKEIYLSFIKYILHLGSEVIYRTNNDEKLFQKPSSKIINFYFTFEKGSSS